MTSIEIRDLYDHYERLGAAYPGYRREVGERTARMVSLDRDPAGGSEAGHDFLIHSRLDAANADAAIVAELAWFAALGHRFEWKLYSHDQPLDLKARLAAHGFAIGGDEAIMALELDSLPPLLRAVSGHDIRQVGCGASLDDYRAVNDQAWPDDAAWLATMARILREQPQRMSAWVAYVEDRPVCAARIDFPEVSPFASLWGGATLEPYRKRGIYTAILAARAREAIDRGYRFLTIDASPMSRPIAARYGFQLLAISNPCDSPGSRPRS
ncbi:MAG: hypothetical protein A2087_02095 [Spirochaetes bacterium GWD1_61_31]|nr:MAG: hypothetical protein A2Y37_11830 [Spirochaetes bacterium GWB1_60_80]OHD35681.1 MAG: hypothetical protein A2004_02945 [Spirochaetes bacterium GWC1_61_12]OHD43813.1 MAG: hypothetical protein A2087_02095 [Spirochaetes bacterium GWD1_61_31]OHD46056.1 MAG: hypothetical protein A2Y35_13655 [Spirochaetes bacterium GWE1_60_18]OHD60628.1 MAG: hypothetical protein A2Y32_08145 [Spirochaetes bacterium GWF1_60_12]HAP44245.1 N-acetyltransferase [Spirochaetaceae bacterium]